MNLGELATMVVSYSEAGIGTKTVEMANQEARTQERAMSVSSKDSTKLCSALIPRETHRQSPGENTRRWR